ncbi:hypothetical protein L484_019971 [Morus notabilis]|uniref:Uncharacterized protein n=1 Tax=Morus notabilis TaxID=981085 RepID=W9QX33_9ROSA|nr:hypothetical protein L484_019971 [Morus notabilis]
MKLVIEQWRNYVPSENVVIAKDVHKPWVLGRVAMFTNGAPCHWHYKYTRISLMVESKRPVELQWYFAVAAIAINLGVGQVVQLEAQHFDTGPT